MLQKKLIGLWAIVLLLGAPTVFADDAISTTNQTPPVTQELDKPTWISLYEPTYILPFYYTEMPDNTVYQNSTPDQQSIKSLEFNYQISIKVPIWHALFNNPNLNLDFAYTQQAFWQLYNESPFFRETDYEPALFVEDKVNIPLGKTTWEVKFLNAGVVHQSNGRGGSMERSWNRIFGDATIANTNWMVDVKPWYVLHDVSISSHNPDIIHYMGYGRAVVAYKYHNEVFSVMARNVLESDFQRGAVQANLSFPVNSHLRGYVRWFSGYGQSLIEYNHYTNAAGIGLTLNDWI